MLAGLFDALAPTNILFIFVGVLAGMFIGALPGLTATMGTALLLPFTFALDPISGVSMLAALLISAMFSDSIPACLINTPGTPAAMATALDGYPMTKQGQGQKAIIGSAISSLVGSQIGGLSFLFLTAPLAAIALQFGPPEFFWVGVFALTVIGSLSGGSLLKGLAGGAIGMMISTIGLGPGGTVRYTFGVPEVQGGVDLVAALIGIFAFPQVLDMVYSRRTSQYVARYERQRGIYWQTAREVLSKPLHLLRSGVIGTFIGILPGAGAPIAALLSYNEAARWSRDRSRFGKGALEGVTASETANNAAAGSSLIPMVALGVPGSAPAAVILGALLLQGIEPGPDLFASDSSLVYAFAWSVLIAGWATYSIGGALSGLIARIVSVPVRFLAPMVALLSVIGAFAIRSYMFDAYMMLGLGVLCWLLAKVGVHPGPIGLGLIMGPIVEPALVQSMALSRASSVAHVFFTGWTNIILVTVTAVSVAWVAYAHWREGRSVAKEPGSSNAVEPSKLRIMGVACEVLPLLGIGLLSVTQLSHGPDWVLPRSLTWAMLIIVGGIVIARLWSRNGKTATSILVKIRSVSGEQLLDDIVFVVSCVAFVIAIPIIGIWITTVVFISLTTFYLAVKKSLSVFVGCVAAGLGATVCAFGLFMQVLFVPMPLNESVERLLVHLGLL